MNETEWFWSLRYDEETDTVEEFEFKTSQEWADKYFNENIKGNYTYDISYGIMNTFKQWLESYIADDSIDMYIAAIRDGAVIEESVCN